MSLDKEWLPESRPLPDGGVEVQLPTEMEWMMAGGKVKKSETPITGYKLKPTWREELDAWLVKWQDKTGEHGKAPTAYIAAYDVLHSREELGFKVDFVSEADAVDSLKRRLGSSSPGMVKNAMKFIRPMLVEAEIRIQVIEYTGGED